MKKTKLSGKFWLCYYPPKGLKPSWEAMLDNGPTYEGVNYVLNSAFRGSAQSSPWYIGLIDASGFVTPAATDTHAAHTWAEFAGVYLSQRGLWVPSAAASGRMNYASVTAISITANGSIQGAFLASRQPTGLSSGAILYSTAPAASPLAVASGGTILAGYKLRLRAA